MAVSFLTLVELAANQIEPESWGPGVTTSNGPATVVSCSSFAMTSGDPKALDGGWLWFYTGTLINQERAIATDALSLSGGDITVGNGYSTTTPSGASFQVHLRYPVTRAPGGTPWVTGYTAMFGDSLRRLWFEDEISITAVASQVRYLLPISTYEWLADRPKQRVMDVMAPPDTTTLVSRPTEQDWYINDDAETPALILCGGGFTAGQVFTLKVARPCNTRIKIGGVWTDVSASSPNNGVFGLFAATDECHAQADDILALSIAESMNHLGMRQPAIDKATWEPRRQYWAGVAARCKYVDLPRRNDGKAKVGVGYVGGGVMSRRGGWARSWGKGWRP